MEDGIMTEGERIMLLRKDRRYSRGQLSNLAGISEKFLYEIEMGKKGFSAQTLTRIADALEVSLDYIMLGEGSRRYEDEIIATIKMFKPNTLKMVYCLLKDAYEISIGGK